MNEDIQYESVDHGTAFDGGQSDERNLDEIEDDGGQSVDLDLAEVEPAEPAKSTGSTIQDMDILFDWLNELGNDETIGLFEVLGTVDPLAVDEVDGKRTFKYSEVQRDLLGEAAKTFKSAGFDSE